MISNPPTMMIPLRMDEHGDIRISGTRVTLDTVIARYHQGDSPEDIHTGFDVLPVQDIYAVIAYYLAHRDELDDYLKRRDAEANRIRQQIEASYTPEQKARHKRLVQLVEERRKSPK